MGRAARGMDWFEEQPSLARILMRSAAPEIDFIPAPVSATSLLDAGRSCCGLSRFKLRLVSQLDGFQPRAHGWANFEALRAGFKLQLCGQIRLWRAVALVLLLGFAVIPEVRNACGVPILSWVHI
jgi:hypothetical protein